MRVISIAGVILGLASVAGAADFAGSWRLNASRSDIRGAYVLPDGFMRVEQTPGALRITLGVSEGGPLTDVVYPLGGRSQKSKVGDATLDAITQWEGDALLVKVIVSGKPGYSAKERWERSADGSRLTITRTVQYKDGESQSVLIFESAALVQTSAILNAPPIGSGSAGSDTDFVVPAGTHILLSLTNSVNTKHSAPGDRVYLTTSVPVFVKGQLVIPQGSYVTGSVTESTRAGRVKGKAALNIRFENLTLPSGISRDFRSRAGSVDAQGNLDRKEGRIEGDSNKGGDIKTVAGTTVAGAGIGTLAGSAAGHIGTGLGIGSAAGAAAGLGTILSSRGPDVVIPPGTTMELVLDRELRFSVGEILK